MQTAVKRLRRERALSLHTARRYSIGMLMHHCGRSVVILAGIALAMPISAFHSPVTTLNVNNMCNIRSSTSTSKSKPSRPRGLRMFNNAPPPSRTAAPAVYGHATTLHRGSVIKLAAVGSSGTSDEYYTSADLDAYSAPWGITLQYKGTLNSYRIEAHRPNGELAGYTTGFYLGDLLHLDKVQVSVCGGSILVLPA